MTVPSSLQDASTPALLKATQFTSFSWPRSSLKSSPPPSSVPASYTRTLRVRDARAAAAAAGEAKHHKGGKGD